MQIIGKMTLNRNPAEFFTETEQIAFCTQNIVDGIDFSNDPLLQGRNFSYVDTQLLRLGGPNFNGNFIFFTLSFVGISNRVI